MSLLNTPHLLFSDDTLDDYEDNYEFESELSTVALRERYAWSPNLHTAPADQDDFISKLPPEVINEIMSYNESHDLLCLGLTCRHFYKFYKLKYKKPVHLFLDTRDSPLYKRLIKWIGPNYRYTSEIPGMFLNISVYGDKPFSEQEKILAGNYSDYWSSLDNGKSKILKRFLGPTKEEADSSNRHWLPNPFNKGAEVWEAEAIEAMENDRSRHKTRASYSTYWKETSIWKRNFEPESGQKGSRT